MNYVACILVEEHVLNENPYKAPHRTQGILELYIY